MADSIKLLSSRRFRPFFLTQLLEILIMLLGAMAFVLNSPVLLVSILFLMGTQSALFGPVKYSLLPQSLKPQELVGGNAMVAALSAHH
jgi:hypothetical protein